LTNELERIRILEGKISKVVAYINKITAENQKLKHQIKDFKSDKRDFDEQIKKTEKFSEIIEKYGTEREMLKEKIEIIIKQIDDTGI